MTVDQFDNVIAMDAAPVKTDCSKLDFSKWVSAAACPPFTDCNSAMCRSGEVNTLLIPQPSWCTHGEAFGAYSSAVSLLRKLSVRRPEVRQTNKPLPKGTKKAPVQNADGSTAPQQQQQQQQYEDEEPKEEQSWLRKYVLER